MSEQDIINKEITKLKQEVLDLTTQKSNLVRDINVKFLEADRQCKDIVEVAELKAKNIMKSADDYKVRVDEYASNRIKETDELLHIAKEGIKELKVEQDKLTKDKEEFNNLKVGQDMDIKDKAYRLIAREKALDERQNCLDRLDQAIKTRETRLAEQNSELKRLSELLAEGQQKLELDRIELATNKVSCDNDRLMIDTQKRLNSEELLNIKSKQDKLISDTDFNQSLLDNIVRQNADISIQKKDLLSKFNLLEKNRKELDEQKISLDEREKLIAVRDKDVTDKIKILQEIRIKSGGKL